MDSLTQIVLGAAVGEVVLGKKLGNRAMVWGAIGGTIPDLDIIVNLFADDMTALAAHRGLSHSLFFAFVGSILFAYLTNKLFSSGLYRKKGYKAAITIVSILFIALFTTVIYLISTIATNHQNPLLAVALIAVFVLIARSLYNSYYIVEQPELDVSFKEWYWFFFWTIGTHIALDVFTSYGTQVFQPFSNYKVALNTISVADPAYTVPFLICLIIAARYKRGSQLRWKWNLAGISLSSLYLLFTVFNKLNVDNTFQEKFAERGIKVEKFTAGPSILNNALWTGTVEGDTSYYTMMMSIFDDADYKQHMNVISKNHELVEDVKSSREIEKLEWCTNEYHTVTEEKPNIYHLSE